MIRMKRAEAAWFISSPVVDSTASGSPVVEKWQVRTSPDQTETRVDCPSRPHSTGSETSTRIAAVNHSIV